MFRLLGPLEVRVDGAVLDVGQPRQRAVLAALLVDAGRPVPMTTLIARVWDDSPPPEARNAVYSHLSRNRRLLAHASQSGAKLELRRERAGYVLDVPPDLVDLHRFRRLVSDARSATDDIKRASLLKQALDLWTGTPMADIPGAWSDRVRERLRRERLDAFLDWGRAMLRRGEPGTVIANAYELQAEHSHAEPLAELLIRALHASGRAAEAMDHYVAVRQRLADDLGTDPGPELRAAHQALLRGDVEYRGSAPKQTVPSQLPIGAGRFTGRESELEWLDSLLDAGTPTLAAVVGGPGVGKTALTVHWANRGMDNFPDGQLYIDLRGYDPDAPVQVDVALAGFLQALGIDDTTIPLDVTERSALFRTLVSSRRMLVVLDNAASSEQVRPLLPGGRDCVVVITSRDSLAGLVARHDAQRLALDRLPPDDAVELLQQLVGTRIDREPGAAAELAEACVCLPLALRIAAEFAAARPDAGIADLVGELTDRSDRLERLDAGDAYTSVRSVLSWSYDNLPAAAARMFRMVGLNGGPDLDECGAAALAGTSIAQARRLLDTLARAHLVERTGHGRFTMHDLLRAYSLDLAHTVDGAEAVEAARGRLYDYLLASTQVVRDLLYPGEQGWERYDTGPHPEPLIIDANSAISWLDREHENVYAAIMTAAEHSPSVAVRLAHASNRTADSRCSSIKTLRVQTRMRDAARGIGDLVHEAHATAGVAMSHRRRGDYALSVTEYQAAMDLYRRAGKNGYEMRTRSDVGLILTRLGEIAEGTAHLDVVLRWAQETDERRIEGHVRNVLGDTMVTLGRYRSATDHLNAALDCFDTVNDRYGVARTLMNLGRIATHLRLPGAELYLRQALKLGDGVGYVPIRGHVTTTLGCLDEQAGDLDSAAAKHDEALKLFREYGDSFGEAHTLLNLADMLARRYDQPNAVRTYEEAVTIFRRIGMKAEQAAALNGLADTYRALGRPDEASSYVEEALKLAQAARDPYQQARAHRGMAEAHADDADRANLHRRRADDLTATLEMPDQITHADESAMGLRVQRAFAHPR